MGQLTLALYACSACHRRAKGPRCTAPGGWGWYWRTGLHAGAYVYCSGCLTPKMEQERTQEETE